MPDSESRLATLIAAATVGYLLGKFVGGWRVLTMPIDEYHELRMKIEDVAEKLEVSDRAQ